MPLGPLKPNQCLILAKDPLFAMSDSNVLLSNFYVRYASGSGWLVHVHGGNVWARNLTVQGDGSSEIGSLIVFPTAHAMFFCAPPPLTPPTSARGIIISSRARPPPALRAAVLCHQPRFDRANTILTI